MVQIRKSLTTQGANPCKRYQLVHEHSLLNLLALPLESVQQKLVDVLLIS